MDPTPCEPMATFPTDGRVVHVRVGARWALGQWATNEVTGHAGPMARIDGDAWWSVSETATGWRERRPASALAPERARESPTRLAAELASSDGEPIPQDEVIRRVTRAILTLDAMHDPEWRFLDAGNRINWPSTVDSAEDIRAQRENQSNLDPKPQRFRPSAGDLSDLDRAVGWFLALGTLVAKERRRLIRAGKRPFSDEQRRLWRYVTGMSMRRIAEKEGVSDETIRRRLAATWQRLWHIAGAEWRRRHCCARSGASADAGWPGGGK